MASTAITSQEPKRVSFGPVSEQAASEHHSFTEDQMATMWYKPSEFKAMKKEIGRILRKKALDTPEEDCWRGLEAFENSSRTSRFRKSILPILKLYWEQEDNGVNDPDGVRSLAVFINRSSTEEAIRRATGDLLEAYDVYRETMGVTVKQLDDCFGNVINTTTKLESCRPRAAAVGMPRSVGRSKNATARTA